VLRLALAYGTGRSARCAVLNVSNACAFAGQKLSPRACFLWGFTRLTPAVKFLGKIEIWKPVIDTCGVPMNE
jgi:hypothetical protein